MNLERWRAEVDCVLTEAPVDHVRLRFRPEHIILARGALDTPARQAFVGKVRAAFPEASVSRQLDRPPARAGLPAADDAERRRQGKRTLVIGALRRLAGRNDDAEARRGAVCRPYPEFSGGAGYCPFDCRFCYVAGNRGVLASPTVKVYVNLEEMLAAIARRLAAEGGPGVTCRGGSSEAPLTAETLPCAQGDAGPGRSVGRGLCPAPLRAVVGATQCGRPYVPCCRAQTCAAPEVVGPADPGELWVASKLGDPLALDPLTHFARVFVPFFAEQQRARLLYLTKSDAVEGLLDLPHAGRTVLSWSLNADMVSRALEDGAPSLDERLAAAARAAAAGYEVRFVLMPIIPVAGWREHYGDLVDRALRAVCPTRITLGTICIYPTALRVMESRFGRDNPVSELVERRRDGRLRFPPEVRADVYRHLIGAIRERDPALPVALCLETQEMWQRLGLDPEACLCNCV